MMAGSAKKGKQGGRGRKRSASETQGNSSKKVKLPNPTKIQKEALLSYMERHTHFACNRLDAKNAAKLKERMKRKMAAEVNASDPDGAPRDGEKWWKCWSDMRVKAKGKAAGNHRPISTKTGGGGPNGDGPANGNDTTICSTESAEEREHAEHQKYTSDDSWVDRIMNLIGWHNALGMPVIDELESDGDGQNRNKENEWEEKEMNERTENERNEKEKDEEEKDEEKNETKAKDEKEKNERKAKDEKEKNEKEENENEGNERKQKEQKESENENDRCDVTLSGLSFMKDFDLPLTSAVTSTPGKDPQSRSTTIIKQPAGSSKSTPSSIIYSRTSSSPPKSSCSIDADVIERNTAALINLSSKINELLNVVSRVCSNVNVVEYSPPPEQDQAGESGSLDPDALMALLYGNGEKIQADFTVS